MLWFSVTHILWVEVDIFCYFIFAWWQSTSPPQAKSLHGEVRCSRSAHLTQPCCDLLLMSNQVCLCWKIDFLEIGHQSKTKYESWNVSDIVMLSTHIPWWLSVQRHVCSDMIMWALKFDFNSSLISDVGMLVAQFLLRINISDLECSHIWSWTLDYDFTS